MIYKLRADKLTAQNLKTTSKSAIYIAPEDLAGDSNLGQLFIVAEINSKEKKVPQMLDQTIKEMSEYYYHSPTKNAEAALETTCQYFNENIGDITGKKTSWVKDKFHILVATIQNNSLTLASQGNIKVWLFRKGKMHDITLDSADKKKTASKKMLSHLVSGQLENNDSLMMTSKTIFDYFADDKIRQTITSLAPTQACAFFKNTVLDYKVPIDFNTVVVKFSASKKEIQAASAPVVDVLSQDKEKQTMEFTQKKSVLKAALTHAKKVTQATTSKMSTTVNKFKSKKPPIGIIKEKKENTTPQLQTKDKPAEEPKKFNLSKHRLKIAILVIAILFVSSLFLVNQKKEKQTEIANIEKTVNQINDKINASEAALIYKDESKAQKLLSEAQSLLFSLPQGTHQEQYEYQQLEKSIQERINQIYHITQIDSPQHLVSLQELMGISSNLFLKNTNLYFASGKAVYKVDPENKTSTKVADIAEQIHHIIDFDKNHLLLYSNHNKIFLFDITNNTNRRLSFSLPKEDSQISGLDSYAKKLYLAVNNEDQVYKYTYNTDGFSNPTQWLVEEVELENAKNLNVDGNIWIAKNDGQVVKLFKGKSENFKITGAHQPISNNTELYTNESLSNLYMLISQNNRIIISNKQGSVGKNILIPSLDPLMSISPSSDEKTLYLLTQKDIYAIDI